jgi:hypothetical protein
MVQQYYTLDLPGKMLYEKEFNIQCRKITPVEQKFILSLSQKQQKTSREYINFIKQLLTFDNSEMTFEELFWFDVQYILYRIRFVTYAKYPIKLEFRCDGQFEDEEGNDTPCTEMIKGELNMGDLVINTPDDFPEVKYNIVLENLGEIKIRNKRLGDDLLIEDFAKRSKIDISNFQMRLLLLGLCIISNGKSLDEMYTLANDGTITAADLFEVETWLKNNIWGVKEELFVKCPKCGKEVSRSYYLALEDFFSIV